MEICSSTYQPTFEINEFNYDGLTHIFSFYEQKPIKIKSCLAIGIFGLA